MSKNSEGRGQIPTVKGYGNNEQGAKLPARLGNDGTFV